MDIYKIQSILREFARERNWDQFHSPKNLAMALAGEVGELLEIFQWLNEEESKKDRIDPLNLERSKEEIADIFLYLIRLADTLEIDLELAVLRKIELNEQKYPVSLSKSNAIKYNRRNE